MDNVSYTVSSDESVLNVSDFRGQSGGRYIANATNLVSTTLAMFTVECKLKNWTSIFNVLNQFWKYKTSVLTITPSQIFNFVVYI